MSTHTGQDDDGLYLYAILVGLTGRRLAMSEIYDAVGLSRQQYSAARQEGKLITPNRMILAAERLGINPVELLAECGILTPRDAAEYVDHRREESRELFDHPTTTMSREAGQKTSRAGWRGRGRTGATAEKLRDSTKLTYDPTKPTI